MQSTSEWRPLSQPPKTVSQHHEIAVVYNQNIANFYNKLTPHERIMIYYLYRASLPGNRITADQTHRSSLILQALFEHIFKNQHALTTADFKVPVALFIDQVRDYLIYLWTNHGPYFIREHADSKRTPARIGLDLLTIENIARALTITGYAHPEQLDQVAQFLTDRDYEATLTVPNSIDQSAVNFYAPDFTDADFERIDPQGKTAINAYFYIDKEDGNRVPKYKLLSAQDKYSAELSESVAWLSKAHAHALKHPAQFDTNFADSLSYLVDYLKTGDEELFKKHSIAWLKTNNRIDYNFGFIETYDDPKSYRALFQADITIKSIDIERLNKLLPTLEDRLPFKKEFKRSTLQAGQGTMPNASINVKAFSAGGLGPLVSTIAYCLPNYDEIRSEHGSKQIMYHSDKMIGELLNPGIYHRLFNANDLYTWFNAHDPEYKLMEDIGMLETILHETLGHGSGKLATHRFVEGDPLQVEGNSYAIGDSIALTSNNLALFLRGYDSSLEELRAEIIALLSSLICYDELAACGMLGDWPRKVGKEKIMELSIISMARVGLRRLIQQPDTAQEISGAHAQANTVILNYLIDHAAVAITSEPCIIDGASYAIIDIKLLSLDRAIAVITELACLVQEIKSTGDGKKVQDLFTHYGIQIRYPDYMKSLKANMKATAGDVKALALIYPEYSPIVDKAGTIVDIQASWPRDIAEQWL